MNPEKPFNPSDPQYQKVEDLPRAFRDDYINTEDETGFVRKEADAHFSQAQREADKNLGRGELEDLSAVDILHKRALVRENSRESIIKKAIEDGGFSGGDEWGVSTRTNEAFERGDTDKAFYLRLAREGVNVVTIPNMLKDDEELLFELAKNAKTVLYSGHFSDRLKRDNNFLYKLVEAGGYFPSGWKDEIIKNHHSNKGSNE